MSLHVKQFITDIIKPALREIELDSLEARALLLCTAAHESALGTYVTQMGGPALGVYQMEPATYEDIFDNYLAYRDYMETRMLRGAHFIKAPPAKELQSNLKWATYLARVHYLRAPELLPDYRNVNKIAAYWKKYYNTVKGAGTEKQFVIDCDRLIGDVRHIIEETA